MMASPGARSLPTRGGSGKPEITRDLAGSGGQLDGERVRRYSRLYDGGGLGGPSREGEGSPNGDTAAHARVETEVPALPARSGNLTDTGTARPPSDGRSVLDFRGAGAGSAAQGPLAARRGLGGEDPVRLVHESDVLADHAHDLVEGPDVEGHGHELHPEVDA